MFQTIAVCVVLGIYATAFIQVGKLVAFNSIFTVIAEYRNTTNWKIWKDVCIVLFTKKEPSEDSVLVDITDFIKNKS